MPNEGAYGDRYSVSRGYASLYGKGISKYQRERDHLIGYRSAPDLSAGFLISPQLTAGGPYVGYGPRNYQRRDARIVEEINERLTWHGEIDATYIEVRAKNGVVYLDGKVGDRFQRRMAEDLAASVSGVKEVLNRLRLRRPKMGTKDYHNIAS